MELGFPISSFRLPTSRQMDDFDPRYCIRCRGRISRQLSDTQDVCDECKAALDALAFGSIGIPPRKDRPPPCPRCGSDQVEREWRVDRAARVVDAASGCLCALWTLAFWEGVLMLRWMPGYKPGPGRDTDGVVDSGPLRTLWYCCRRCEHRWKAN